MEKLKKVLGVFLLSLVISSCETELNQITNDQNIEYSFEQNEMLANLELAAIRVGEVAVNDNARQEIIEGVNIRFNGDVMVPIYDLIYPESSDLNLRIKTSYFSEMFLSDSHNARTKGNELKRLINYLEEHGFIIYAPYQDKFDWKRLTVITVSYHPINRSDENIGIEFDFSDKRNVKRNEVVVNDVYAKENPSLLIIPSELSDGNEKYRPNLNSENRGARGIPCDPDDPTCQPPPPPPPPPTTTTYSCNEPHPSSLKFKIDELQLREQLDGLFGGGSEIKVWTAYPDCCYQGYGKEIADMFFTRSEIDYGTWKNVNKGYPKGGSPFSYFWIKFYSYETNIAIIDHDGWPNGPVEWAGTLTAREDPPVTVPFYFSNGTRGDEGNSLTGRLTYCQALEKAYDGAGNRQPITWGNPTDFAILMRYQD